MAQTCINRKCNRTNPDEAAYCYYDGVPLDGVSAHRPTPSGSLAFPSPVLLPSGVWCRNFDDLLRGCQKNWSAGVHALQSGLLADFFGQIGRGDLAQAARAAASGDDLDLGLNELLAVLPSQASLPPRLQLTRSEIDLSLEVGQETSFELRLANEGQRMLCGAVQTDCPWLSLGEGDGSRKDFCRFKFQRDWTLPIHVLGGLLGACARPLEGRLEIASNGGDAAVVVRVRIAPRPFPHGVLAGAAAPRDLVERVRRAPLEAAAWFENGAVEKWYRTNGWLYPLQAPAASGLDAVQQFFSALGLPPPDVSAEDAPPRPFEGGVLAGARNPQELIERARRRPREAAVWFENGEVARWHVANGWDYPVKAPAASGLDAVRQFFHSLGLPDPLDAAPPPPPRTTIELRGAVGQSVMHRLMAKPRGRAGRPFSARATSNQTWLQVGPTELDGTMATIPLVVPTVPNRPGAQLRAQVNLTLNDAYQTELLVILTVEAENG